MLPLDGAQNGARSPLTLLQTGNEPAPLVAVASGCSVEEAVPLTVGLAERTVGVPLIVVSWGVMVLATPSLPTETHASVGASGAVVTSGAGTGTGAGEARTVLAAASMTANRRRCEGILKIDESCSKRAFGEK